MIESEKTNEIEQDQTVEIVIKSDDNPMLKVKVDALPTRMVYEQVDPRKESNSKKHISVKQIK